MKLWRLARLFFDDILINSDDSRAAAALEIISEVARHTQVLFFTHHTRLAELGTISGARVIQLAQMAAAAVASLSRHVPADNRAPASSYAARYQKR